MQIILQEDIEKLGTRGDVVSVKEGYARNYLLPRNLALEASPGNLKRLEKIRTALAKRTATEREGAQKQADLLKDVSLSFTRKAGDNDQLFGSVTSSDIAEALAAQGFEVDKRRIELAEPIKVVGQYEVTAKLVHGVAAAFKVNVSRQA
jgi:large subunit ribosomal protein L9